MDRAGRVCRSERGFTLIEVMLVVALVAVLAALALPNFFKTSRKGKADSEVSAVFAELAMRQEQYKQDNNGYLATAACPSTSTPTGAPATNCTGTGLAWAPLRSQPPLQTLRCSYVTTVGNTAGTNNPGGFVFTSPAMNWYYIIATCDTDGSSTLNSTYFTSSVDSAIQSQNAGQ